jgi:hypothetical protein
VKGLASGYEALNDGHHYYRRGRKDERQLGDPGQSRPYAFKYSLNAWSRRRLQRFFDKSARTSRFNVERDGRDQIYE